jgi:hypothetical protein
LSAFQLLLLGRWSLQGEHDFAFCFLLFAFQGSGVVPATQPGWLGGLVSSHTAYGQNGIPTGIRMIGLVCRNYLEASEVQGWGPGYRPSNTTYIWILLANYAFGGGRACYQEREKRISGPGGQARERQRQLEDHGACYLGVLVLAHCCAAVALCQWSSTLCLETNWRE